MDHFEIQSNSELVDFMKQKVEEEGYSLFYAHTYVSAYLYMQIHSCILVIQELCNLMFTQLKPSEPLAQLAF